MRDELMTHKGTGYTRKFLTSKSRSLLFISRDGIVVKNYGVGYKVLSVKFVGLK